MPDQPQLTPAQKRAIPALLSAPSITEAARESKVSKRSIFRWLRENAPFQDALAEARQQALAHAATRLQHFAGETVETMQGLLQSDRHIEPGRASLVRTALDFAFRAGAYDDLQRRLRQLEKQAQEQARESE